MKTCRPRFHRTIARSAADVRLEIVGERLLGIGITETMTGTLTSLAALDRLLVADVQSRPGWAECVVNPSGLGEHDARLEPIQLLNPPSNDRNMLRVSLLPSMLQVTAHNLKQTDELVSFLNCSHILRPNGRTAVRTSYPGDCSGGNTIASIMAASRSSYYVL
jgi:phenylalanyl-tRNA synthetase beta subunit